MVVVGDDEIHAERPRERGLADRCHPAVHRYDDARAIGSELTQRQFVQAISLLVPVRDVGRDPDAELAEGADEDGRSGDAGDVVVPIDDDALASRERTTEPLDRAIEIEHRGTVLDGSCRDEIGHRRKLDAAGREDARDQRRYAVRGGQLHGVRQDPAAQRDEAHHSQVSHAGARTMAGVRLRTTMPTLLAFAIAACSPSSAAPSPTPTDGRPAPSATAAAALASGLAASPDAILGPLRLWYVSPDPAFREDARVVVTFPDTDPTAGRPRARLRSNGRVVDLVRSAELPATWSGALPLDGAPAGRQIVEVIVRLRGGEDVVVGTREFTLSAPEYVVWTLDFEGDAAGDAEMANTAAIADGLGIPMTVMWNPRVWTTSQVSGARAEEMLAWTKGRLAKGDEVALHVHMWTDFVGAAGLAPRTTPSWAGRGDGYDVPLTAYDEAETRTLVD